jgi:hypothetical protein
MQNCDFCDFMRQFQRLYGEHFTKIQTIFGSEFCIWFNIVRRVLLKVAKKLTIYNISKHINLFLTISKIILQ